MATDRLLQVCDLLLGAAHADGTLDNREGEVVRELLADLCDDDLPPTVDARIAAFAPERFDLAAATAPFANDSEDDRKRLLYLVDAVHEADEEIDLAEDDFLQRLAAALKLPPAAVAGMSMEIQIEELQAAMTAVRKGPPPIPRKSEDVDVDLS